MEFEWDEAKRQANLAKHGIDFADAGEFEWGAAHFTPDERKDYGEDRIISLAPFRGCIHQLIFTQRGPRTRIISFRKAGRIEVRTYEKEKNRS